MDVIFLAASIAIFWPIYLMIGMIGDHRIERFERLNGEIP